MTTRLDIATALTGSAIVTGYEFRPSVFAPGAAWGQVISHDRADGFFVTTWGVYVVLPANETAAATWYDANLQTLHDALRSVVYIDRDEPILIPTANGDLFGLLITARSE